MTESGPAVFDVLVLAGHGIPVTDRAVVIGELSARVAHRSRRVATRTARRTSCSGSWTGRFPD